MPEIQFDSKIRVVALQNLEAMCDHVSGSHCHKFAVARKTSQSVWVSYSNEDEYAHARPFLMHFVAYRRGQDTFVILEAGRTVHETADHGEEGWQCFQILLDCPTLWRNHDGDWLDEPAIKKQMEAARACHG